MRHTIRTAMVGLGLLIASTTAVEAQLVNMPTRALPSSFGNPSSSVAAFYGRGLNDASGKQNAYGLAYARTGLGDRVNVGISGAMVDLDPDSKFTFGGNVGVDLLGGDASTQISLQGGVGYLSLADQVSTTNVPVGVAVRGRVEGGATLGWWFMPRLNYTRASVLGLTGSATDLGASAGLDVTTSSGFGVNAALDLLASDPDAVWLFGIGAHYVIG